MMNQKHPYWENPLDNKFTVTIITCTKDGNIYKAKIKEDVIRPAGGGQAGDRGTLVIDSTEFKVIDTAMENDSILLITEKPIPENKIAILEIDLQWRRAMMRNHTAEHLFVGTLQKMEPEIKLGYIWIDGERAVIELVGNFNLELLYHAEKKAQELVSEDVPLSSEFINPTELNTEVRAREGVSQKELVRIVRIGNYDASACSGTHVSRTGDIGCIKIADYKIIDKGVQIELLTGVNAILHVTEIYNLILRRRYSYPFEMSQIGAVLDKAKGIVEGQQQLTERISEIISRLPANEIINEIQFKYEILPGFSSNQLRNALKELRLKGPMAVLYFTPGTKSNLIFWTNELPLEAKEYIESKVSEMGGKGGGRGDSYTGGFTDVENPDEVFLNLVKHIREKLNE